MRAISNLVSPEEYIFSSTFRKDSHTILISDKLSKSQYMHKDMVPKDIKIGKQIKDGWTNYWEVGEAYGCYPMSVIYAPIGGTLTILKADTDTVKRFIKRKNISTKVHFFMNTDKKPFV